MNLNGTQQYLTPAGLLKIQSELDHLKTVKRVEVAEKLEVAISHGDLSENADYDYAKQEQALVEGRILDLEDALRNIQVIDEEVEYEDGRVRIGSTVTLAEQGYEEIETYRIVGVHEANPAEGLISNESPIGSALIDAKIDDTVVVNTPGGDMYLQIKSIS